MKIIGYLLILILLIFGITFALLNAVPVTFHYYLGEKQLPLSLLLVMSFGVGLVLTFFVMSISILKLKAERRGLKKKIKVAEQELNNLRSLPVKD